MIVIIIRRSTENTEVKSKKKRKHQNIYILYEENARADAIDSHLYCVCFFAISYYFLFCLTGCSFSFAVFFPLIPFSLDDWLSSFRLFRFFLPLSHNRSITFHLRQSTLFTTGAAVRMCERRLNRPSTKTKGSNRLNNAKAKKQQRIYVNIDWSLCEIIEELAARLLVPTIWVRM